MDIDHYFYPMKNDSKWSDFSKSKEKLKPISLFPTNSLVGLLTLIFHYPTLFNFDV
jgi:hypothetical protein